MLRSSERNRCVVSAGSKKSSISTGAIVGIAVASTVLVLGLIGVGIYALRQKKRAEKAMELSKPFGMCALAKRALNPIPLSVKLMV